jgi:hypothetical protein
VEVKAMYGVPGEHYAVDNDVLTTLDLHPTVEVKLDIEETRVKPIGPQDMNCQNAVGMFTR